ncbi:MAG: NUDIX hydrolase, partial [Pseudomonadota bacterium]|nr:NUDIX hydrolase [Pseudomonadota bacterium]
GERELLEETGYVAQSWEKLATFYPCIGYSNEKIIFTCAKGLCLVQPNPPKDNELLDVITLPLQESLHMIQTGSISDTKTVSGLLWLATFSLASSSIA